MAANIGFGIVAVFVLPAVGLGWLAWTTTWVWRIVHHGGLRDVPQEELMSDAIVRLNPKTLPDARETGYSQISIVEPGRLAFISGQVAWRPGGEAPPATLLDQTAIVVANAKAALDAVGATPHDLVAVKLYATDLTPERMAEAMPLVMAFFDGAQPSLTGVGVAALAAPDLQVEMEMIVRLPG